MDHTVTNDCTMLDPRDVCTIATTFHPSAIGARDATITVAGAPGGVATLVMSGTARPRLEVVTLSGGGVVHRFEYGAAVINTMMSHDVLVTVRNNTPSDQPLSVTASAEFSMHDSTCSATDSIAADGGTCTVRVRFTPTTLGPKTGSVTFAINTGAVNQAVQLLSGTGIESLTIAAITSPFNFVGPDATPLTFFTSGASLAQSDGFRYLKYIASLSTSNSSVTPAVNDVTVCFATAHPPQSCLPAAPAD